MSESDPFDDPFGEDADDDELVPAVDVPEPDPAQGDLDSDTARLFVRLVVVFNVALFGVTVGPMFLYFEGDPLIGGALLAVGVLAGVYGTARYWQFQRRRNAEH